MNNKGIFLAIITVAGLSLGGIKAADPIAPKKEVVMADEIFKVVAGAAIITMSTVSPYVLTDSGITNKLQNAALGAIVGSFSAYLLAKMVDGLASVG